MGLSPRLSARRQQLPESWPPRHTCCNTCGQAIRGMQPARSHTVPAQADAAAQAAVCWSHLDCHTTLTLLRASAHSKACSTSLLSLDGKLSSGLAAPGTSVRWSRLARNCRQGRGWAWAQQSCQCGRASGRPGQTAGTDLQVGAAEPGIRSAAATAKFYESTMSSSRDLWHEELEQCTHGDRQVLRTMPGQ